MIVIHDYRGYGIDINSVAEADGRHILGHTRRHRQSTGGKGGEAETSVAEAF